MYESQNNKKIIFDQHTYEEEKTIRNDEKTIEVTPLKKGLCMKKSLVRYISLGIVSLVDVGVAKIYITY